MHAVIQQYTLVLMFSDRGIDYLIGDQHSPVFITTLQALSVKKLLLREAQYSVAERSVAQFMFLTVAVVCCRLRQLLLYYHFYLSAFNCVEHSETWWTQNKFLKP